MRRWLTLVMAVVIVVLGTSMLLQQEPASAIQTQPIDHCCSQDFAINRYVEIEQFIDYIVPAGRVLIPTGFASRGNGNLTGSWTIWLDGGFDIGFGVIRPQFQFFTGDSNPIAPVKIDEGTLVEVGCSVVSADTQCAAGTGPRLVMLGYLVVK